MTEYERARFDVDAYAARSRPGRASSVSSSPALATTPSSTGTTLPSLVHAGWKVEKDWIFEVPTTPEEQRDWLLVPMFNQHELRGLPDEARLAILERAYNKLWDGNCAGQVHTFCCFRAIAI
jgi:hypothetical protein